MSKGFSALAGALLKLKYLFANCRFANGFGADARRKRHTADSGYGSEQPLDRRWSQDFSQDVSLLHLISSFVLLP